MVWSCGSRTKFYWITVWHNAICAWTVQNCDNALSAEVQGTAIVQTQAQHCTPWCCFEDLYVFLRATQTSSHGRLRKTNLAKQSPWENCTSSSYTLTHLKKNNKLWKAQTCLYSLCFMLSDSSCLLWVTSRSSRERGSVNVSCIFWLQLNKNTVMLHSESLASRWHSMILGACTCGLTFRYRLAQVMKWSRANTIIL